MRTRSPRRRATRDARAAIENVDAAAHRLLDELATTREGLAVTGATSRAPRLIAKLAPKRRAGRGSFAALKQYLEVDERKRMRDDLVASWSGLVASHETSALEMEAVAQQARDAGKRRDLSA